MKRLSDPLKKDFLVNPLEDRAETLIGIGRGLTKKKNETWPPSHIPGLARLGAKPRARRLSRGRAK